MKIFLLLGLTAVLLWGFGLWRFARVAGGLEAVAERTPEPSVRSDLPAVLREMALAGGAVAEDLAQRVVLTQAAEMRLKRGAPWQALEARQVIATGAPEFVWVARQSLGPLPKFGVIDRFIGGQGSLQVWLAGALRIANGSGSSFNEAEAMRYLAELPWAPDAILGNPAIVWRELGDGRVEAALPEAHARVTFTFTDGDITGVEAEGRPATGEDGTPTRMDWRGRFSDYAEIGGRRIPREAQVGYVWPDGEYELYFRGRITGYTVFHSE